MSSIQPYNWCKFQISDEFTMIGQCIILMVIVIFIVIFIIFIRKSITNSLSHQLKTIMFLITTWLVSLTIKTIYGIAIYETQLKPTNIQIDTRRIQSGLYYFIDLTTTFLLHSVLLVIVRNWLNNFVQSMVQTQSPIEYQDSKLILTAYSVLKFLRMYAILRTFYIIIFIGGFLAISFGESLVLVQSASLIMIITWVQSFITMVSYLFSFKFLNHFKQHIPINSESQFYKINYELKLLVICCLMRQIYLFVFYFFEPIGFTPLDNCTYQDYSSSLYRALTINIFILIGHITPMLVVIYIYWYQPRHNQQTILQHQQQR